MVSAFCILKCLEDVVNESQQMPKVNSYRTSAVIGWIHLNVKPFYAAGLFRYSLKTSEHLWFSDVFRGYRKRPVA